jgi:hypothetical protein
MSSIQEVLKALIKQNETFPRGTDIGFSSVKLKNAIRRDTHTSQ